jgi:arsenate reductase-like glutaredoxin family protein
VDVAEQRDARKQTMGRADALALVKQVDEVYAAKGKRVVHLDLRQDRPDEATLLSLLLGPTGNLRAPTLRKGRTLVVGFDPVTYARVLK